MISPPTSPVREMVLLWRIWHFLRQEKPDIVFGYTIKNNIYGGICCRWLGIPFIPNVTGLGPAFNESGWLNRGIVALYRHAFAKARIVFFQNIDDRATFLKAGITTSERTKLLPGSGVDLAHFTPQLVPRDPQTTTFLLVSRLLWDKGIGIFVEAAQEMKIDHPDLRFQILGPPDPSSRSSIDIDQVMAWQDEGIVEYLGETTDVRPALSAADCVVLPTWYREGTPRTLLEAAAMAVPVITTDTPGCRAVVENGVTGFLCKPRDRGSLISAMLSFIALNAEDRVVMRQRSRRRAETTFSEDIVIKAYLEQLPKMSAVA